MVKKTSSTLKKAEYKKRSTSSKGSKTLFERIEIYFEKNNSKILFLIVALSVILGICMFDVKISTANDDALYIEGGYKYAQDFFNYYYTANAPLYPMFLSIPISIVGINLIVLKSFSLLFFILSIFFLYKAFKGRIPYLILFSVLLLIAVNSSFLTYASLTFTETFFLMFQALFFIVFFKLLDKQEQYGINLSQTWTNWLLLGLMLLTLYLTRSIAAVTIVAVLLFFVFQKKYINLLYTIASFGLFVGLFEVLKRLVWGSVASQFKSQGGMMFRKDVYDASKGQEDFSGFVTRFFDNLQIYYSSRFWEILGLRKESSPYLASLTIFTLILIIIGFIYVVKKKNKNLLISTLYFGSLSGATFIAIHAYWGQGRLIMVFIPFILFTIFFGFYQIYKLKNFQPFQFIYVAVLLFLIMISLGSTISKSNKNIKTLKENLKGDIYYGYTPDWVNYLKMSKWCGENLPNTSLVACRKAPMSFIYSNGKTFYGVYSVAYNNPDSLLFLLQKNKVTHVLLANLRANPKVADGNIISTLHRMVQPIAVKYPNKLKKVHEIGDTEPAELYEIIY